MSQAVHHLIGFLEPDDEFSVADYTELAHKTIADITSRGKIAVMAGGTGLYHRDQPHPAPVQAHGGGVLGPAPASQRCRQAAAVLNLSGKSRSHGGKSSHKALWS